MTTKAHFRQSEESLIDMLRTIQKELATHRTMMLNIQVRLSQLEHVLAGNNALVALYDPHAAQDNAQLANRSRADEDWSRHGACRDSMGHRDHATIDTN